MNEYLKKEFEKIVCSKCENKDCKRKASKIAKCASVFTTLLVKDIHEIVKKK